MIQNSSINSVGETIRIFPKGSSICKSWSPVTIHKAFAATANSSSILSFGSRQATICSTGVTNTIFFRIVSINSSRWRYASKYRSNFFRKITKTNSINVCGNKAICPLSIAWLIALALLLQQPLVSSGGKRDSIYPSCQA